MIDRKEWWKGKKKNRIELFFFLFLFLSRWESFVQFKMMGFKRVHYLWLYSFKIANLSSFSLSLSLSMWSSLTRRRHTQLRLNVITRKRVFFIVKHKISHKRRSREILKNDFFFSIAQHGHYCSISMRWEFDLPLRHFLLYTARMIKYSHAK